jgi:hypothetical protein
LIRTEDSVSLFSWLSNLFSSKPARPQDVELGRNDPCWCGSGKKYKKCHFAQDEKDRYEEAHAARVAAQLQRKNGIAGRPPAGLRRPEQRAADGKKQ